MLLRHLSKEWDDQLQVPWTQHGETHTMHFTGIGDLSHTAGTMNRLCIAIASEEQKMHRFVKDKLHTLHSANSGLSHFYILKDRSNFMKEKLREKCQTE